MIEQKHKLIIILRFCRKFLLKKMGIQSLSSIKIWQLVAAAGLDQRCSFLDMKRGNGGVNFDS